MIQLKDCYLVLFLNGGSSLVTWHQRGILEREAELYRRLRPYLSGIAWVTYGGTADLGLQEYLPDIDILVNRWRLPNEVYMQQLPWLHREYFQKATLLKSEQTGASAAAVRVANHYGTRYIARSGFSLALFVQYNPDDYETSYEAILQQEKASFDRAQHIIVTTEEMRETAIKTHAIDPAKISINPNFVNTERFRPPLAKTPSDATRLLFIGRLTKQKNVLNLVRAVGGLSDVHLTMIGSGELESEIRDYLATNRIEHIQMLGNKPSRQLPDYFGQADIYVQPSLYEGHPKTIFEAMACRLPVIAGNSPGIRQFIAHGETGWLCETDVDSIRDAIRHLIDDETLRQKLGANGRDHVVNVYSLDRIVESELGIIKQVLASDPPPATPYQRPILKSVVTYGQRVAKLLAPK